MKNRKYFFALILMISIISACSQKGEEYVGSWYSEKIIPTSMKGIPDTVLRRELKIIKNGESFIISKGRETIPAVLNDSGILETHGGLMSYSYVTKTDKLTDGDFIYDRQSE